MCKHGCLMVNCSYNYKLLDKCLMVNSSYQKHSHGCHELTRNPYKKNYIFLQKFPMCKFKHEKTEPKNLPKDFDKRIVFLFNERFG